MKTFIAGLWAGLVSLLSCCVMFVVGLLIVILLAYTTGLLLRAWQFGWMMTRLVPPPGI